MLDALKQQDSLIRSMASSTTIAKCGDASTTTLLSNAAREWTRNLIKDELLSMHRLIFGYCEYATTGSKRFTDDPELQATLYETVRALCKGWFASDLAGFTPNPNTTNALSLIDEAFVICEEHAKDFWHFVKCEAGIDDLRRILIEDSALGQHYPRIVENSIPVGFEPIRKALTEIYLEEIGFDGGSAHAELQKDLLQSLRLPIRHALEWTDWRALAGINLLSFLSLDRWQFPRFIGALYTSEGANVRRTASVDFGLRRVNLVSTSHANYYALHGEADVGHTDELKQRVLIPILQAGGGLSGQVVEGARLWVQASQRYDAYLKEQLAHSENMTKHERN
jgi:Iron-containing redox enzyme